MFYTEFVDPVKKGFVAHAEQSGSHFSVPLRPLESLNDGPALRLTRVRNFEKRKRVQGHPERTGFEAPKRIPAMTCRPTCFLPLGLHAQGQPFTILFIPRFCSKYYFHFQFRAASAPEKEPSAGERPEARGKGSCFLVRMYFNPIRFGCLTFRICLAFGFPV